MGDAASRGRRRATAAREGESRFPTSAAPLVHRCQRKRLPPRSQAPAARARAADGGTGRSRVPPVPPTRPKCPAPRPAKKNSSLALCAGACRPHHQQSAKAPRCQPRPMVWRAGTVPRLRSAEARGGKVAAESRRATAPVTSEARSSPALSARRHAHNVTLGPRLRLPPLPPAAGECNARPAGKRQLLRTVCCTSRLSACVARRAAEAAAASAPAGAAHPSPLARTCQRVRLRPRGGVAGLACRLLVQLAAC